MFELIFSVVAVTILSIFQLWMFTLDISVKEVKIVMAMSIFVNTIIVSLLSFILNSPLIK